MSFGGITIDSYGPTRDFPSKSMMVGLVGSALGLKRTDGVKLQDIQDRMVLGCSILKEGRILVDMQNARLSSDDIAWKTDGVPEKRTCGDASFDAPERRRREYIEDGHVLVALRMQGKGGVLTEEIEQAFRRPKRPIFIGRKCCTPSMPLVDIKPYETAETSVGALGKRAHQKRALWDAEEGPTGGPTVYQITSVRDVKNWITDIHQGERRVVEGDI